MKFLFTSIVLSLFIFSCGSAGEDQIEDTSVYGASIMDVPELESNRLNGQVKSMTTLEGSDSTVSYYNKQGYMDSVQQFEDTLLKTMVFKRDENGWINSISYLSNGQIKNELIYSYNENRTSIKITFQSEVISSDVEYDEKGRKVFSRQTNSEGVVIETRLQYDEEGNVVSRVVTRKQGENIQKAEYEFKYNSKNHIVQQIERITVKDLTSTETSEMAMFEYDHQGNWIYRRKIIDKEHAIEQLRYFQYYE